MFLIRFQDQRLVLVHLGTQGSGDILRTGHELTALVIQSQHTGIPLTDLPSSSREGCMDVLRQEAFTISFGCHATCNKGLLLHSWLCSHGTCHIMQIPHLIPLVGSEDYGLHDAISAG